MERVFFLKTVRMIFMTSLTLSWVLIGIKVLFPELTDGTLAREPQTVEELTETETTDPSLIPSEKEEFSQEALVKQEESSLPQVKPDIPTQNYSNDLGTFKVSPIPVELIEEMEALQPIDPSVITYDQLRLITVSYHGFDNQVHEGQLIMHQAVAKDIIFIFKELLEAKYPIEKINLITEYNNSDRDSMAANNTSAFNFRTQTSSEALSMHAYGLAIDINPVQNPYVSGDYFLPANGMLYLDRSKPTKGMIQKDDVLYRAFTSRGWTWGGEWNGIKDYQHFEKRID